MIQNLVHAALAAYPQVELAIVFGSQATGRSRADSDVDVAVMLPQALTATEKMEMVADLAMATGRAIDLIDLRTAGEPLLGQILQHGHRIRGTDERYAQLVSKHLLDEADFMPYVRRMLAERRRAFIGT